MSASMPKDSATRGGRGRSSQSGGGVAVGVAKGGKMKGAKKNERKRTQREGKTKRKINKYCDKIKKLTLKFAFDLHFLFGWYKGWEPKATDFRVK